MKNNDIKRILKESADKVIIKDFSQEIIASVDHPIKTHRQKRKEKSSLKMKWVLGACAAVVCLLLAVIPLTKTFVDSKPLEIGKEEGVFSQELIAAGNALYYLGEVSTDTLSSLNTGKIAFLSSSSDEDDDQEDEEDEKAQGEIDYTNIAYELDSYLKTTSLFLNNSYQITYIKNKDKEYKKYDYKMTIIFSSQNSEKYIAYYNEKSSSNKSDISGIMLINNQEFKFDATQKEKEDKVKMDLIIVSKTHKIKISNENAIDENEYSYEYYSEDKLVKSVEIEVENEEGKTSTEISITENEKTVCYEFEQEIDSNEIECSYELDNIKCSLIIQIYDEYNLYVFEKGEEVKVKK